MGGVPIRSLLIKYVTEHTGVILHVDSMAADMNEKRDRVLKGMQHIYSLQVLPGLEKVASAVYCYKPNQVSKSDKKLFELIATTKKGDFVLQDEDGNLYRAQELE